jgi:DnaJ-class molecular chaperone
MVRNDTSSYVNDWVDWCSQPKLQNKPKKTKKTEKFECDYCDGCGWTEGGATLQTTCIKCNGKGYILVGKNNDI